MDMDGETRDRTREEMLMVRLSELPRDKQQFAARFIALVAEMPREGNGTADRTDRTE